MPPPPHPPSTPGEALHLTILTDSKDLFWLNLCVSISDRQSEVPEPFLTHRLLVG